MHLEFGNTGEIGHVISEFAGRLSNQEMHGLEKLIKNACNCLLSVFTSFGLEIQASNEFIFSNQNQTAVLSFWVLISGVQYCVIRSSSVCFVWQNRSRTSPVPIF